MLIASKGVAPIDENNSDIQLIGYTLSGKDGYNNAIEKLNKICSIYGNGKGAESARSLSATDVEKLTGITQTDKEDNSIYTYNDYGSKYSYIYEDVAIKLSKNEESKETLEITEVYFPDEIINSKNPGPKEVTASFLI